MWGSVCNQFKVFEVGFHSNGSQYITQTNTERLFLIWTLVVVLSPCRRNLKCLFPHQWFRSLIPLCGLVWNRQTWFLDGIVLLSLSEAPIGRGVGEDGVRHRVWRVALNAVLDVTDRQLGLQEEVELAVWQAHGHVHHSARSNGQKQHL